MTNRNEEEIRKDIEELEKELNEYQEQRIASMTAEEEATANLKKQLEKIIEPYEAEQEALSGLMEKVRKSISEKKVLLRNAEMMNAANYAHDSDELTADGAIALLKSYGVKEVKEFSSTNRYGEKEQSGLSFKKKIGDLYVFRDLNHEMMRYFVFQKRMVSGAKKWMLVGFWKRRNGEHPGDDTQGYGWFGRIILNEKSELGNIYDNMYERKVYGGKFTDDEYLENHFFARKVRGNRWNTRSDVSARLYLKFVEENADKVSLIDAVDTTQNQNIEQMNVGDIIYDKDRR